MRGESKRLTAEQKGKGKAAEKKVKTKEDKEWEIALNASHALEHQRSGRLRIADNPPSATQTPESVVPSSRRIGAGTGTTGTPGSEANPAQTLASRKRTRADVDTVQETAQEIEDENNIRELILKSSCSVVTVATVIDTHDVVETIYGTGFILVAEENYCLIFTSYLHVDAAREYYVHFKEERKKTTASMLINQKKKFSILFVKTDKKHAAVIFDYGPLSWELIYTVGAMAGSKLNADANAPVIEEVEGFLGIYEGEVTAPTYYASDYSHRDVSGTENYFQIICDVHDDIITLENVDNEVHTADIILTSPVFRLNGKATGMICQHGVWGDVKDGLFAKSIISCIQSKFRMGKWEERLKKIAKEELKKMAKAKL